ncbi:MAG TPA: hypothetical protein DD670_02970 [Planctomycetaceae bacterium]|nr:hypothetical protein [Planctomycetaceae bacterium]
MFFAAIEIIMERGAGSFSPNDVAPTRNSPRRRSIIEPVRLGIPYGRLIRLIHPDCRSSLPKQNP